MRSLGRTLVAALLAAVSGAAGGCLWLGQNPSDFPYLLPSGPVVREHAKPPGHGYFANFDKDAVKLEVHPLESSSPVGTEFLVVASVLDNDGKARRRRRIEWMLEGAGNIVEVDESGYFNGRGYKVDNRYAVSFASMGTHTLKRGAGPADDITIQPGQTWCVISSAVEGDSFLTVYAPGIADWNQHRVVVTKHWVDCQLRFPQPAVSRFGEQPTLTTQVLRTSGGAPVSGYKVRYRLVDGGQTVLLPTRAAEAEVTSNAQGSASVAVAQLTSRPGPQRVAVEVLKPDPANPTAAGIVVGRGETTVEWQSALLAMELTAPSSAGVNGDVPVTLTLTNNGPVATGAASVQMAVPEGLQLVRSEPAAQFNGSALLWQLPGVEANGKREARAVFRAARLGTLTFAANAQTQDGLRSEARASTTVGNALLLLKIDGPPTATLGDAVTVTVMLTNPGTGPATNVSLRADLDPGLTHESGQTRLALDAGTLAAGETRPLPLALTAKQAGRLRTAVTVTADGGMRATADHAVTVRSPRLEFTIAGPPRLGVDRPGTWDVRLRNGGDVPLNNVQVRVQLPPGLTYASSTGGRFENGQVVWQVGAVPPGQQQPLQFTAQAGAMLPRGVLRATASADRVPDQQAETAVEVLGLPAVQAELIPENSIVDAGGVARYTVRVRNAGTLALLKPQATVLFPATLMQPRYGLGASVGVVDGQGMRFAPLDRLEPGQSAEYRVEAAALAAGDARVRVEVRAENLPSPLIQEEAVRVTASGRALAMPEAIQRVGGDGFRAPR